MLNFGSYICSDGFRILKRVAIAKASMSRLRFYPKKEVGFVSAAILLIKEKGFRKGRKSI
jgi:hypothetical protein